MTLETKNDEYKVYEALISTIKQVNIVEPSFKNIDDKVQYLSGAYGALVFVSEKLLSPRMHKKLYEYAEHELDEIRNKL